MIPTPQEAYSWGGETNIYTGKLTQSIVSPMLST